MKKQTKKVVTNVKASTRNTITNKGNAKAKPVAKKAVAKKPVKKAK